MLTSLQKTWQSLPLIQRVALAGVAAAVFGGLLLVAQMASRPTYSVLFSNLEPEDAGAVTSKLRELKVDYRLSQGGRAIEVPADKVYDMRLSMATEGLPRGGSVGFELFDRTSFGATDFTQHLNYQRALQGELTRTINRLDGVLDSRIHLALPEKQLFSEKEQAVTASVVLHLRPGYQMDERRVAGIVHLVSSAVEGLKPENVTVHDSQGELLSSSGQGSQLTDSQIEQQERYERRLESELERLAEQVLGPDRAAIRVSADLNWDQTETTSETYRPTAPQFKNLLTEEEGAKETYGRQSGPQPRGAPGVASNMRSTPVPAAATIGSEPGQYINSRFNNRYVVNKFLERKVTAPGKIRRLSVAVLLDQTVSALQQRELKAAFAAAAGLDLTAVEKGGRGDHIELLPMPFDRTRATEATRTAASAEKVGFQTALIRNGAAVVVVLLVMIASLVLLRRTRAPQGGELDELIGEAVPLQALIDQAGAPRGLESQRQHAVGSNLSPALSAADRVRQLAAGRPEDVARQLQVWLSEEGVTS
jgi:flagellar M-ring protein FliF